MGLDMYLYKEYYIGGEFEHKNVSGGLSIFIPKADGDQEHFSLDAKKISSVRSNVMYWRKANAIHQWFVDNVQDGEDDCGDYHVTKEELQELLDTITKVLDGGDADELLPTQAGFFFGSTNYDEWYWKDLQETQAKLRELLAQGSDPYGVYTSYIYTSSW